MAITHPNLLQYVDFFEFEDSDEVFQNDRYMQAAIIVGSISK